MAILLGLIIFIFWGYSDIKSTPNKFKFVCKIIIYIAIAYGMFELFDYLSDLGNYEEQVMNIHDHD